MANHSTTHVLEIESGIGEPAFIPLSLGQELQPISVGRKGMWRIESPRVLDVHMFVYFDGVALFVQSADDETAAAVDGQKVATSWTELGAPCRIEIGGAMLRFRSLLPEEDDKAAPVVPARASASVPAPPPPPPGRSPASAPRPERPFRPGELATKDDESTRVAPVEAHHSGRMGAVRPAAGRSPDDDTNPDATRPARPSAMPSGRVSAQAPAATSGRMASQPPPVAPTMVSPQASPTYPPHVGMPGMPSGPSLPPGAMSPPTMPMPMAPPGTMPPGMPMGYAPPMPMAPYGPPGPMHPSGMMQTQGTGPSYGPPPMPSAPPPMGYPQPYPGGQPPTPGAPSGLAALWRDLSTPKKILVMLAPFSLLSATYLLVFDEDARRGRRENLEASDAAAPSPGVTGTTPPPGWPAGVPFPPPGWPPDKPYPWPPPGMQLPTPTPVPSPVPSPVTSPSPPPSAANAGAKSLERQAVDAYAAGDYPRALATYEQLARQYPDNRVYAEAIRILKGRMDGGT